MTFVHVSDMPFVSVNCQVLSGLHQNWRVFLLVLVHADDRANNRHGPDQSVLHGIHPGLLHLPVVWWRHVAGAGEETAENVDWSSDLLLPGHHGQVCPTGIYLVNTWTGIYLVFTWSSWLSVSYRYLSSLSRSTAVCRVFVRIILYTSVICQ